MEKVEWSVNPRDMDPSICQESSDSQRCCRMSIASFIKQDLIASIRSGKINSDRLTLDALSKRYQVSTRPVRAAVRQLIEEKYLEKGDNGRLAIRRKPPSGAVSPPQE